MSCTLMNHSHPVHFNRGRHGHVWICLDCEIILGGPNLPKEEKDALVFFAKSYANRTLIYHAESDALFESFNSKDVRKYLQDGCDDVTGHPKFEQRFRKEKLK